MYALTARNEKEMATGAFDGLAYHLSNASHLDQLSLQSDPKYYPVHDSHSLVIEQCFVNLKITETAVPRHAVIFVVIFADLERPP